MAVVEYNIQWYVNSLDRDVTVGKIKLQNKVWIFEPADGIAMPRKSHVDKTCLMNNVSKDAKRAYK